jgi:hypothetical protein
VMQPTSSGFASNNNSHRPLSSLSSATITQQQHSAASHHHVVAPAAAAIAAAAASSGSMMLQPSTSFGQRWSTSNGLGPSITHNSTSHLHLPPPPSLEPRPAAASSNNNHLHNEAGHAGPRLAGCLGDALDSFRGGDSTGLFANTASHSAWQQHNGSSAFIKQSQLTPVVPPWGVDSAAASPHNNATLNLSPPAQPYQLKQQQRDGHPHYNPMIRSSAAGVLSPASTAMNARSTALAARSGEGAAQCLLW